MLEQTETNGMKNTEKKMWIFECSSKAKNLGKWIFLFFTFTRLLISICVLHLTTTTTAFQFFSSYLILKSSGLLKHTTLILFHKNYKLSDKRNWMEKRRELKKVRSD